MSKNQTQQILDSDNDGLSDEAELKFYKTNPYNPDTDGDGVPDGVEVALGRNPRGSGLLQDLFIPHRGNNWRPKALHLHRIFFYSVSAVVIKVLVIALVLSFPIQAWLTPDLLVEQSQRVVETTNNLRASLNIPVLNNNPVLQQVALAKTEDMLVNQYFAHVSPEKKGLKYWLSSFSYKYQVAGENLALGFSEPEEAVRAWQASPTHYANLIDPDFKEIGVAMVSGNYQGYDTTLVAQFFGTKQLVVEENVDNTNLVATTTNENVTLTTTTEQVLSARDSLAKVETKPIVVLEPLPVVTKPIVSTLQQPVILSPANDFVSKSHVISLLISAPEAEMLAVWSSDVLLTKQSITNNENTKIDIDLATGKHQIFVEATKDDNHAYSQVYNITIDDVAPTVDQTRTEISANQPVGQESIILKVDAYLSEDTDSAKVQLSNYTINLQADDYNTGHWTGHLIIADAKGILNPLLMASLTATDAMGNSATNDISWGIIPPVNTSVVKQYLFLKNTQASNIAPLFDISSIYYKVILLLAVVALLLNIFIEVKKQHPQTIASAMGFIALLVLLILF